MPKGKALPETLVQMPSARKCNWSHTTWMSVLTAELLAIGGLTLPLPQAVFWVCSPSAPDNSLQTKLVDHLTVSGWLKQNLPVNSPSSTLLLTMLLHWNSWFFNMSLNFFSSSFLYFLFLVTFFPICELFWVVRPPCSMWLCSFLWSSHFHGWSH